MVHSFPVALTSAQVRKIKSGGAITLKPSMVRDEAKHLIHLAEPTAKKVLSALKKMKGVRISLDEKSGEGFSLNHLVDAGKKALKSKEGKMVVKSLLDTAMEGEGMKRQGEKDREDERLAMEVHNLKKRRGRPKKGGAIGAYLDKDGKVKVVAKEGGNIFKDISRGVKKATKSVGDFVEKEVVKPVSKTAKKASKAVAKEFSRGSTLDKIYRSDTTKALGKMALEQGGKFAGEALGAYLGGPEGAMVGEEIGSALGSAGAKQIGAKRKGGVKGGFQQFGKDVLKEGVSRGKALAMGELDKMIDANLTGREAQLAKMAIRGNTAGVKKGAISMGKDYAKDYAGEVLGGIMTGSGMRTHSARMVLPATDSATFSPYARVNSAQMTPYIHSSPQLARPIVKQGSGAIGDILGTAGDIASTLGLGINPAGYGSGIYPAGYKSGDGAIGDILGTASSVAKTLGLGMKRQGEKDREDERLAMEIHNLKRGRSIYPAGHSVHTIGNGAIGDILGTASSVAKTLGLGINPAGYSSGGAIYNPTGDPMIDRQNKRIGAVMRRHYKGRGINPAGYGSGFNPA
jgi:hypothetical protein